MSICQGVGEGSSWEVGGEGSLEMSPRLTALWEQEGPGNAIWGVTGVVGTGPGVGTWSVSIFTEYSGVGRATGTNVRGRGLHASRDALYEQFFLLFFLTR